MKSELAYQFARPIKYQIDDLLANGVVPTGIVVGSIFFACDQLLRVEQLAVGSCAHLVCGLKG